MRGGAAKRETKEDKEGVGGEESWNRSLSSFKVLCYLQVKHLKCKYKQYKRTNASSQTEATLFNILKKSNAT